MRTEVIFACAHCDAQYPKWAGRCQTCGQWGSIAEQTKAVSRKPEDDLSDAPQLVLSRINDIAASAAVRFSAGIAELDRVLGGPPDGATGGIVPGSVILLAGEPGIGKSTLALQAALAVPNTLYFSAEESAEQIKLRADRLSPLPGGESEASKPLRIANAASVESIVAAIRREKPPLAVIDSVQTIASSEVAGEAGSVSQVRACAAKLMEAAKAERVAVLLIGHVTKDGSVAGPRTLEHLVDVMLSFEGDRHQSARIVRCLKNRFGATDEAAILEMKETGLAAVADPARLLLADRRSDVPGSILACVLSGSRPLLLEAQALVSKTVFGYPVRKASGFDLNRLHVLTAVLERRAGLPLGGYDIHINIAGGLPADEPAADLPVCLAIASACKQKIAGADLAAAGEVGLGGEIRSIRHADRRAKACAEFGLKRLILPGSNDIAAPPGLAIIPAKCIEELVQGN